MPQSFPHTLLGILLVGFCSVSTLHAHVSEPAPDPPPAKAAPEKQRDLDLAKYLTGKKFVGQFTIDGQTDPPKTEEYEIRKCEKLAQQDMYRLTARIRYGKVDTEVPMDMKILFAGETPVITLDSFWIPGMGTFDARVLIRRDHYAGTWKHDTVGGHLYGKIEPMTKE